MSRFLWFTVYYILVTLSGCLNHIKGTIIIITLSQFLSLSVSFVRVLSTT